MATNQPHHSGHRSRIKHRFTQSGLTGWPEHEILELALFYAIPQGDVKPLAYQLLDEFGSLAGVFDAPRESLLRVKGVGEHTASLLTLISSISGAYVSSRTKLNPVVNCPADAYPHLSPYFFGQKNEMVYALYLDGKNQVLGVRKIAEGSITSTDVNARRLAEEGFALRAIRFYLAHNHVASLALPSQPDLDTTNHLMYAMSQVGLFLEDHLIFVDDDMVSLRESTEQSNVYISL